MLLFIPLPSKPGQILPLRGWSTLLLWIAVCGNSEKFRPSEVVHYPYLECSISYSLPVGSVSDCYLAEGKRDFGEKGFFCCCFFPNVSNEVLSYRSEELFSKKVKIMHT